MRIRLPFTKMSGAGNDFIVLDNMRNDLQCDKAALAVALCTLHTGVGADGLLILEQSAKADFFMRYYNADGTDGGMCGNGGRCAARYAYVTGIAGNSTVFEALDYLYRAEIIGDNVRLHMKDPMGLEQNVSLTAAGARLVGDFVDTGSPHFVVERKSIEDVDVVRVGRAVRHHSGFAPDGCNVNFVERRTDGVVAIRTYERGVEAETLACGTGCVASAVVLAHRYKIGSPITLNVRSGEAVRVYFEVKRDRFSDIMLEGSAHFVFSGTLVYDTVAARILDAEEVLATSFPVRA